MTSGVDMMAVRRRALDDLAPIPAAAGRPFEGIRVQLVDHLLRWEGPADIPTSLVETVAALLAREGDRPGPGAAVVAGLASYFELDAARAFHSELFHAVWEAFRRRSVPRVTPTTFRTKTTTISDGAIPLELYGSRWSFKQLHIDRDALLFSHLYGPVTGFTGGELLLVDIWPYMTGRSLRFDDLFEWSDEPTEGSKPVLRVDHHEAAQAECGVVLGGVGPDEIVFVNNLPDAGILHGVTPVSVTDPGAFHREYHRCSVKELPAC